MRTKTKVISNMSTKVGGWIVKPDGIEFVAEPFHGEGHGYFISHQEFNRTSERSWTDHLSDKRWFTNNVRNDFNEAVKLCNSLQPKEGPTCLQ